jgi:D-psicose/D-tagatose/L-ribulose 3-epimerase
MKFGICTLIENAPAMKAAGWDYVEESVQGFFQGLIPDSEWRGMEKAKQSPLPVAACNLLVPGQLKITGPEADLGKLRDYMTRVTARAGKVGTKILVFGSAGARQIPEGFDLAKAREQIIAFAKMGAELAGKQGVTIVVEPLNSKESNVVNSVKEGMEYVEAVGHPNFKCLVDSYHFWLENEPLENLRKAMKSIAHVHLADTEGRVAPGLSGKSDYRPFFKVLREGGYNGMISVESAPIDIAKDGASILAYIKEQWNNS